MKRQSFAYGAAILVAASLFNRVLGFIYQILIIDLIGAKGIGLFNMVYPIYVLAIVLSTVGVPVAVSKFVAEKTALNDTKGAYAILQVALIFLFLSGMFSTALLYLGTPFLLKYIFANPQVLQIFQFLIPGVFLVAISSAFRGYFQGLLQMKPTAASQIFEQMVRVFLGLAAATYLLPLGVEMAAAGTSLGVLAGELAGLITILIIFLKTKTSGFRRASYVWREYPKILTSMFTLSIPVTASRLIATIILSLEASLIPKRLQIAGFSLDQATTIYGQLTGMAITVLVLPSVVTNSLSTTLIPAVAEAVASNNMYALQSRISEAIRITLLAGLPCFITFVILPSQITDFLFHCPEAGLPLKILSLGGIFYYLQQTTTGILQGLGQAKVPLRNLIIASILELLGLYYLTAIPSLGISGAAWAVNISFIVVASLNLLHILPYIGRGFSLKQVLLKPLFSTAAMAGLMYYSYKYLFHISQSNNISTLITLTISFVFYFAMLVVVRAVSPADINRLPRIGRIINTLLARYIPWWRYN